MRDTEWESTYEEVKHLLASNQIYAQLKLDCDCISPYDEQHKADCHCPAVSTWKGGEESDTPEESDVFESDACEDSDACESTVSEESAVSERDPSEDSDTYSSTYEEIDTYRLNLFAMEHYELRPIPHLEYIIHETPDRMKNIFAGLEYDPLLTVGLWDEREGSFYGEKVPYLQRRRADGDDAWETLYRDAEYLSSDLLRFDHVNQSSHKSLFVFAVAMNINECLEIKDFNMPKRIFKHFRRLTEWTQTKQSWPDLLRDNTYFLKASHERKQSASFDVPYLGYPRQDCEKEEDYESLIRLTDSGLLVLGGQGPDRGLDWRGGHTFRSAGKEYRWLPCLEFVVQGDPRSNFIQNLIADVELAVNIHRGDGSVYTTDPKCCEYLHRELKPEGLWKQQQVSERSLRHFCLDHLPLFRHEEVLICTVAMKITENTKDMLMGNEQDFAHPLYENPLKRVLSLVFAKIEASQ
ncbi:hypothetical protein FANTH_14371 [Fusarium anthophilum]|uniref:Uncharacterized protein n=1 Tax=Fusarium anthophilum TaxID=48485 RepID=A0A8H5DMG5_9HYPO|nr:hypothetical protein FANTH_14371 [Fusarium anthophilum]